MKTRAANFRRLRRSRGGSAVILLLALLSAMLLLIAANTSTLNNLTREVKALEKRQTRRLDPSKKPQLHPVQNTTNLPAGR